MGNQQDEILPRKLGKLGSLGGKIGGGAYTSRMDDDTLVDGITSHLDSSANTIRAGLGVAVLFWWAEPTSN